MILGSQLLEFFGIVVPSHHSQLNVLLDSETSELNSSSALLMTNIQW